MLEWAQPSDPYYDYCLWDYRPLAPTAGKLRSSTLLWHSFETLGAPPRLAEIVRAIKAEIGAFRTVWGVKKLGDRYSWELYFYDYGRLERTVSIERVLAAIAPFAGSNLALSSKRPYFMFSIDLDEDLGEGRRCVDELSVYLGNPSAMVSSGLCYQLSRTGLRFDNLYYFFDREKNWDDIVGKVCTSAHLDLAGLDPAAILWPELCDCGIVVVANKKHNDGVYFSRIRIDQLIWFVEKLDYPSSLQQFLRDNKSRLDHMLYDVGIDYRMIEGRIEILKSAYYGVV
ncbi:hypothetical protein EDC40_10788 [Aminobacter aminovorans]|uniref:Uncharacterized protein n=1 Tax=Aminobacter aminovorans TaxID=83263 RepID=A0A381IIX6_AMIAI|nr:hypothetical protein [Aminobacter aminovorans]TCS24889.1 hypothetical protein EDC40_10788 [Aminobacter aminovorans]SUY28032.1 Uncharacterised protein [Aminobacter aminovorans]